jgi:thiamine pyrophosphokinase
VPQHPDNTDHPATTLVVLGGEPVAPDLLAGLAPPSLVVAADSGIDQAHRLGLVVDVAVGDFDSVSDDGLARAVAQGASIHRHPAAKAATDMVLALDVALERGCRDVLVVGGAGGRLDHLLANALVMASPRFAPLRLRSVGPDGSRLHVVRGEVTLVGQVGEYVSLLPLHGPASGVRTTGLRYALDGQRLDAGTSRGVSNELTSPTATVAVDDGVLLAVLPGPTFTPPHTRGTD